LLEGYELANARIDWNGIGGSNLDLGFYVKNVLDTISQSGVSILLPDQPFNSLYVGPPRTWRNDARFTFDRRIERSAAHKQAACEGHDLDTNFAQHQARDRGQLGKRFMQRQHCNTEEA
jgi:hypothetical protein